MRHDPAGASIIIMLRSLKLHGMAHAVDDLVTQGVPAFEAATPMLSQLLKAEMAEREVRSIAYHTKVARFPSYKDLTGFDFASSDINEATVRQLHRGEFIENAKCASTRPSNWSTHWSKKRPSERLARWLRCLPRSIWSSLTSSVTYRSARQAVRCCSTFLASFMSAPASS
jgi:hypothetical protein